MEIKAISPTRISVKLHNQPGQKPDAPGRAGEWTNHPANAVAQKQAEDETLPRDQEGAEEPSGPGTEGEDAMERLSQLRRQAALRKETADQEGNGSEEADAAPYGPEQVWAGDDADPDGEGTEREGGSRSFRPRLLIRRWLEQRMDSGRLFLGRPGFRLLLTTIGGVAVGLLFGFVVLTVFTQEQMSRTYLSVLDGTVQTLTAPNPQGGEAADGNGAKPADAADTSSQASGGAVTMAVHLPEQTFIMAQAGVFSSADAAGQAVSSLKQQGLPHFVYESAGKQYLFVATAPNRDDILGLATFYKNRQMDVYVKEWKLPGLDKPLALKQALPKAADGSSDKLESFFADGTELARNLAAWSSRTVNGQQKDKPVDAEELAKWKETHLRFVEEGRAVQAALPDDLQPYVTGMVNGLNQAMTALDQLKPANAESYAWQVQAGVLAYLENCARWVQTTS